MTAVLGTGQDPLHMMLSEFATTDLTSAMLTGKPPSFPPAIWEVVDRGPVWWGRDTQGYCSLSTVFQQISSMALYLDATTRMIEEFSIDRIRIFEAALRPTYASLAIEDLTSPRSSPVDTSSTECDTESAQAFSLVRIFQHAALIYLYRAVCGLPANHALVQQHTQSCLDCIFSIQKPSKILNCAVLPICIAGAHSQCPKQQRFVRGLAGFIYDEIRFASVHSVIAVLEDIWKRALEEDMTWNQMFANLNPQAIIL
nr:hypothetical protein FVER53263_10069 [Fusarium verticillioides]